MDTMLWSSINIIGFNENVKILTKCNVPRIRVMYKGVYCCFDLNSFNYFYVLLKEPKEN